MRSSREPGREPGDDGPTAPRRFGSDAVAGGVVLAFAIFYLIATFAIPPSSFTNAAVGPRAMPIVIGVGLALAAAALIVRGLRGSVEEDGVLQEETPPQSPVRFAVIVGLLVAYILLFLPLGYVLSTFLFILGITMYLDRGHPVRNMIYALVFSLVVYFVFTELLGVALPRGPLGI